MYYSQLLELKEVDDKTKEKLDEYFKRINTNEYLTISKCHNDIGLSEKSLTHIFTQLYLLGFLSITYAIRCPECGHLLKRVDDLDDIDVTNCYACGEDISITEEDIIVLFNKSNKIPFVKGQHPEDLKCIKKQDVAPNDSLAYIKYISDTFQQQFALNQKIYFDNQEEIKKRKEVTEIKNKAFVTYKKNKKKYMTLRIISLFLSAIVLYSILVLADTSINVTALITVIIYTTQNVIDVILKLFINTDLDDLERKELYYFSFTNNEK